MHLTPCRPGYEKTPLRTWQAQRGSLVVTGEPVEDQALVVSSSSRLRWRVESTLMPGPIVVAKTIFFR